MIRWILCISSVLTPLAFASSEPLVVPALQAQTNKDLGRREVRELREKLSKPIVLENGIEANTPLRDALEFLSDQYDVSILVDMEAFKADENTSGLEDAPVRLPKISGVRFSMVLRLLLSQVHATYLVLEQA